MSFVTLIEIPWVWSFADSCILSLEWVKERTCLYLWLLHSYQWKIPDFEGNHIKYFLKSFKHVVQKREMNPLREYVNNRNIKRNIQDCHLYQDYCLFPLMQFFDCLRRSIILPDVWCISTSATPVRERKQLFTAIEFF